LHIAKEQNHKLTLPDMAFLQNDITSLAALEFQKLFAVDSAQ